VLYIRMGPYVRLLVILAISALPSVGQHCPRSSDNGPNIESSTRILEGTLVFHDSLRKWFELKLDQPQCGQSSTELVRIQGTYGPIEVLRGCHVRSTGPIGIPVTGYYSLETYQDVKKIEPVGTCVRQPLFPDYSRTKPNKSIRVYRVEMHLTYGSGDNPIVFRVTSGDNELQPWQAYASYNLTGGFVLYGHCGKGFVVDKVFGTPQANPSHFEESRDPSDMASFDPESAAAAGIKDLLLGYTCVRSTDSTITAVKG
jgi:hypothetical protein